MPHPARRVFMVRYECEPEHAAHNAELLRALFDQLHQTRPPGIRYAAFDLDDGVGFVHLVVTETDSELTPLNDLEAYRELQQGKAGRFARGPVITELRELGSFRVFAE